MSREKNEGRIIKKKRRWECGRRGGEKSRILGRRREKVQRLKRNVEKRKVKRRRERETMIKGGKKGDK